jgi:hypothetical protein
MMAREAFLPFALEDLEEPHSSHPEQSLVLQPQRTFHGSEWVKHQSKQHPVSLQLLHSSCAAGG